MLNFHLFRVKVYPTKQLDLFEHEMSRPELLRKTIFSIPSAELRKGKIWQIGNVTEINNTGAYFRVGRVSKSTIEVYEDGQFLDAQFESAPYTHIVLDFNLELCAVAKKSRLSPKVSGIANQIARLLNQSEIGRRFQVKFELGQINDPKDLITHIRRAHSISKFWMTFARPNLFDVEEDFVKPMEKALDSADGQTGKAEIKGDNLNSERLEELARSAAASGNDASAWIQTEPSTKKVRKNLRGNPVVLTQKDLSTYDQMTVFYNQMTEIYRKIRGLIDGEER